MSDECRRYRVLNITFDTRPHVLAIETQGFGIHEREQWEETKSQIRQELTISFGEGDAQRKEDDFIALGPAPFSVVSYHNHLLAQCRRAFISGAYYPALIGACGLGERLLNHLILDLRYSFGAHPMTKQVASHDSIQNWNLATNVLRGWDVINDRVVALFRRLERTRQAAVHFRPVADAEWRDLALEGNQLLNEIIRYQFGTVPNDVPWLFLASGAVFLKRSWEEHPFVNRFYVPCCALVSPRHELRWEDDHFTAYDDPTECTAASVTDEEYAKQNENQHG